MGGELLLRSDWLEIAEQLQHSGIGLVVFTNGFLLDRDRISQLRSLAPRTVGLSLDAASAKVHDGQRGVEGSFDRAWRALGALRENGLPTSVITTLTRHNLYELPALARRLLGQGVQWQIQIASANGARMKVTDQVTPLEFYWAACWLSLIRKKYGWPLLPVAGAHDMGYHSTTLGNVMPPGYTWRGCTAGLDTVGIQSNGHVKGCLSLPDEFVEGNLRERSLCDLWSAPDAFPLNRRFESAKLGGFCATCRHGADCRGGCSDLAYSITGSPYNNPYCLYRLEQRYQTGVQDQTDHP
jgi:radical SAM protein with 4Fe4S-binding SPASM domain